MKKNLLILMCAACFGVFAGCAVTPEGETVIKPEAIQTIDEAAAIAEPLAETVTSLGLFWPPAAVIGGILAGVAGAWRKMKPELEQAKGEAQLGTLAGEATAVAIDEFKKKYPDEWDNLSRILADNHGITVENFYRGLRGLPPKG
jgi:hypothetical protein